MRGKYSPTVTEAYCKNQNWFNQYAGGGHFDPEGYDSYGYNTHDVDRAGNHELDYICNDAPFDVDYDWNDKYDLALSNWTFDGTKPIKRI